MFNKQRGTVGQKRETQSRTDVNQSQHLSTNMTKQKAKHLTQSARTSLLQVGNKQITDQLHISPAHVMKHEF